MQKLSLLVFPVLLLGLTCVSQAQSITRLTHSAPDGVALSYQMTDGTVLAQGGNDSDWWKLTPDITGSYVNGTWTQVASLPSGYAPDAEASAVLADGRLLIEGGEYNFGYFRTDQSGGGLRSQNQCVDSAPAPAGLVVSSEILPRQCCPMAHFLLATSWSRTWLRSIPRPCNGYRALPPARAISTPKRAGRSCPMAPS